MFFNPFIDEWTVPAGVPGELLPTCLNYLVAERNYRRVREEQKGKGITVQLIDAGLESEHASEEYHAAINDLMKKSFKRGQ